MKTKNKIIHAEPDSKSRLHVIRDSGAVVGGGGLGG
jgi:hypothetical protein